MAPVKAYNEFLTFQRDQLPECTVFPDVSGAADLSICLVNWNTCGLLRECLASIYQNTGDLKVEIFVIDNASSDDSTELVKQEFPHVHLVENTENLGFARANNQGIARSTGRYVMLLNPDTLILPGALQAMVRFLDCEPDTGAVAARLLNSDGSLQYSVRKFPNVLTPFTENTNLSQVPCIRRFSRRSRMMDWDHDAVREVDQPAGAAFMIKRHVLETLGPLNSRYHMFFEDVDICYRIRRNGWKIYYLPSARIIHHGGQSVKKRSDMGIQFYKSLIRYFRFHQGKPGELRVRLSMIGLSMVCLFFAISELIRRPDQGVLTGKSAINVMRAAFFTVESGS